MLLFLQEDYSQHYALLFCGGGNHLVLFFKAEFSHQGLNNMLSLHPSLFNFDLVLHQDGKVTRKCLFEKWKKTNLMEELESPSAEHQFRLLVTEQTLLWPVTSATSARNDLCFPSIRQEKGRNEKIGLWPI